MNNNCIIEHCKYHYLQQSLIKEEKIIDYYNNLKPTMEIQLIYCSLNMSISDTSFSPAKVSACMDLFQMPG